MKQLTLATVGFERYAKTTRRTAFLDEVHGFVTSTAVCALMETFLSQAGQWSSADWCRLDVAHLFFAAVVQPVGPVGRRGALRFVCDAAFRRDRSRPRAGTGRKRRCAASATCSRSMNWAGGCSTRSSDTWRPRD